MVIKLFIIFLYSFSVLFIINNGHFFPNGSNLYLTSFFLLRLNRGLSSLLIFSMTSFLSHWFSLLSTCFQFPWFLLLGFLSILMFTLNLNALLFFSDSQSRSSFINIGLFSNICIWCYWFTYKHCFTASHKFWDRLYFHFHFIQNVLKFILRLLLDPCAIWKIRLHSQVFGDFLIIFVSFSSFW